MGNLNQIDRELLSAYLDDALDGSERSRAEHLLATDPGASRYFSRLRATREYLKSVPNSKLRSSLSDRVLEQARVQALAEGLPSNHHVLRASAETRIAAQSESPSVPSRSPSPVSRWDRLTDAALDVSSPSGSGLGHGDPMSTGGNLIPSAGDHTAERTHWLPRNNRITWAALAAVAAVIGGLAVLPLMPDRAAQELVAEHSPPQAPVPEQPSSGGEATSPFESLAANDRSDEVKADENAPLPSAPLGSGQSGDKPNGVAHVMQGDGATERLKQDLAPQVPAFDFLMIVDAVVAREAWESGRFEKLLEELGIPIASPIVADKDLFKALEETRVAVGSAEEDAAGNQPRAALVFLRADGATLDRLHQAMHADRASFPQVVTDLSIDEHSAVLHKLLRGQATSQLQRGPSARVLSASVDIASRDDVVPSFVPAERHKMVSSERKPAVSMEGSSAYLGTPAGMSEVLVILREPSK